MSSRIQLHVHSSDTLRLKGPTDQNADASVLGATGFAELLEERADATLTAAALSSATAIFIPDTSLYAVGDTILIWVDDGTVDVDTVAALASATEITLTTGLSTTAAKNRQVAKRIGAQLALVEYGTIKAAGDKTGEWGYRVNKEPSHVGLVVGQRIRVYYTLDDGAGKKVGHSEPAVVVQ